LSSYPFTSFNLHLIIGYIWFPRELMLSQL